MASTQIAELLELETQPVAVTFRDVAPEGVPRVDKTAPIGQP